MKWEYFTKLYERDKYNVTGKWCPKITSNHLNLNSMSKMRVSLAVQVQSLLFNLKIIFIHNNNKIYK